MRLGSIRYINSLPVDLGLSSQVVPVPAEIVRGAPSELNRSILEGQLDLSPVSAFFYAENQSRFWVLPDISISSESGVMSVLLFSRGPLSALAEKEIAVTGEGKTTPALLEILCRKFYGFKPRLTALPSPFKEIPAQAQGLLLIGDDALTRRAELEGAGWTVTDLAQEWRRQTGLGFVFALWVVRRDFAEKHLEEAEKVCRSILASKKWGLSHLEEVIARADHETGLGEPVLRSYFSCLSYELGEPLVRGMNLYFDLAVEMGLLPPVEPLRFFDRNMDSSKNYRYNDPLT